jgi:putative SOS response-associated peptidase YedK
MCGRYSLATPNPADVRAAYPIGDEIEVDRRFNIAPGDPVLAVTTDREGAPRGEKLKWGLVPPWAKSPDTGLKLINARVETAAERPAYRGTVDRFRCLVIADGFYEWRRDPAGGPKQAFWITRAGGGVFAFAGLWSTWHRDPADPVDALRTCTILTTAANAAVAPLHDRMPIILPDGGEAVWLDPVAPWASLGELLNGLSAAETSVMPVGPAVNDARYDGPECLAPPLASAQETLF